MRQGDVALLQDPVAKRLLESAIPARLAYVWTDGTPRVVPINFHWNGREIVLTTTPNAPKLKALRNGSKVALTIDETGFPPGVLLLRGSVTIDTVDGLPPESIAAAQRYFGEEQSKAWVERARQFVTQSVRVAIHPELVGLFDFQTRFPSTAVG